MRSYRDTIRLLLCFAASDKHTKITRLSVEDLTFDRVLGFLRYLEHDRGNHARTRNQRLAALHTLFGYIASRERQMLGTCRQVAAIPAKRAAPAQTRFLERDEVEALFRSLPRKGRLALRDRALLLFLYNTGARVTPEVRLVDGVEHLDGGPLDDLAFQRGDGDFILPLLQPCVGMFRVGGGQAVLADLLSMSMAGGADISGGPAQRWRGLVRRAAGLRCPDAAMRSRQAAWIRSFQVMQSRFPGPRRASS